MDFSALRSRLLNRSKADDKKPMDHADLLAEGSSYVDMLRKKIATLNGLKIKGELTIEGQEQLDIFRPCGRGC